MKIKVVVETDHSWLHKLSEERHKVDFDRKDGHSITIETWICSRPNCEFKKIVTYEKPQK